MNSHQHQIVAKIGFHDIHLQNLLKTACLGFSHHEILVSSKHYPFTTM
jgi:hypothetical protein